MTEYLLYFGQIEMFIQIADQFLNNGQMKNGSSFKYQGILTGTNSVEKEISISTLVPFVDHTFSTEALMWAASTRSERNVRPLF